MSILPASLLFACSRLQMHSADQLQSARPCSAAMRRVTQFATALCAGRVLSKSSAQVPFKPPCH